MSPPCQKEHFSPEKPPSGYLLVFTAGFSCLCCDSKVGNIRNATKIVGVALQVTLLPKVWRTCSEHLRGTDTCSRLVLPNRALPPLLSCRLLIEPEIFHLSSVSGKV
ncbi:hypothetical protein BDV24DRAFT_134321 [Aspergillus arachidicola]|uniref:Uncharacterized protein n=1 Tax=Aspergillus arachidicola TaxID=656916 RepID=A0A5N6Y3V2_9EURO|nr:hypothetical protein BDV24DRAFT_134321 [Aspergillus arachidicola]